MFFEKFLGYIVRGLQDASSDVTQESVLKTKRGNTRTLKEGCSMRNALRIFCVLALVASFASAQQKDGVHGFAFGQVVALSGQDPDLKTFRARIWEEAGPWTLHLDTDLTKQGDELNQLWIGRRMQFATVRLGKFFLSDEFGTVTPFENRAASYPRSEGALGPFFGWGAQAELNRGAGKIIADVYESGPSYHSLAGAEPTVGVYLKYGGTNYVALGGRYSDSSQRVIADGAYTAGRLYLNASAYYYFEPEKERQLTGIVLADYQLLKYLAIHAQADAPPKGDVIYSAGVGAGSRKGVYFAFDRERTAKKSGYAARLQYRVDF